MRSRELWLLVGVAALACASSLPIERRDYILAHPHGWVELTLDDRGVPLVPVTENDKVTGWRTPEVCIIGAKLEGEELVDSQVFPQGEREPSPSSAIA